MLHDDSNVNKQQLKFIIVMCYNRHGTDMILQGFALNARLSEITEYKSLLVSQGFQLLPYLEPEEDGPAGVDGPHALQRQGPVGPDRLGAAFDPGADDRHAVPLLLLERR